MPASPSSLISSLSCAPALVGVPQAAAGLPAVLAHVPDPRAARGIRHRLPAVVSAAVCAVIAGYLSYTAIAEWAADASTATVLALGIAPDRRPSEAMIRRLLQAIDPDLLTAAIGSWLAAQASGTAPASRRAIAVDGKTLRGSRDATTAARHVLTAYDVNGGVVLAATDVEGKTNEITRFAPLLDQINDLSNTVITVDALHCQRDHVTYLTSRGADWILTVKGNQPKLRTQLAGLPWKTVSPADRHEDRGHGRREIRTLKAVTIEAGIEFPHAVQALQIRRRRRRLDQPKRFTTETIYAITNLRPHQARPAELATWIRGHWAIENQIHWIRDVTYDEDRSQIRTGTGPHVMAALRNAAISALRTAGATNIAAANRHHARDSTRPPALLGIT